MHSLRVTPVAKDGWTVFKRRFINYIQWILNMSFTHNVPLMSNLILNNSLRSIFNWVSFKVKPCFWKVSFLRLTDDNSFGHLKMIWLSGNFNLLRYFTLELRGFSWQWHSLQRQSQSKQFIKTQKRNTWKKLVPLGEPVRRSNQTESQLNAV